MNPNQLRIKQEKALLKSKETKFKRYVVRTMQYTRRAEARRVEDLLSKLIEQRRAVVPHRLGAESLPLPKLKLSFWGFISQSGRHTRGTVAIGAYNIYIMTDREIQAVIDHELTHYVQYKVNAHASPLRRLVHPLQYGAFTEGFADFVSSITSGLVAGGKWRAFQRFASGRKVDSNLRPYIIGFIRYQAIAKSFGAEEALRIGLNEGVGYWMTKTRDACRSLGVEFV